MKKLLSLLVAGIFAIGCSGGDDETPTPVPIIVDPAPLKIINKKNETEIKDGDVIVFNTNSNTSNLNALKFYFKNNSASPIKVRTRLISFAGTNNLSSLQYCIGNYCLTNIAVDTNYPANGEPTLTVPAYGSLHGDSTIGDYKIQNTESPVAPATKVDYVFEAFQYDSDGNEVGNKVRFTYRYQP